ncbi:hypothetical protein N6H14_05530 [Paenibacillus sp. CC-CFT747]|nr:hypothetical protein N6H14_05530 [Paenibacillus sp. CC-CFT747]
MDGPGEGAVRTHPAESYPHGYLNPALFGDPPYPEVETRCAQEGNALLAVRSLTGLHNQAEEIADEWIVHRFRHQVETVEIKNSDGARHRWLLLRYPEVTVALTALQGIVSNGTSAATAEGELEWEQDEAGTLRIRRILYRGKNARWYTPVWRAPGPSSSGSTSSPEPLSLRNGCRASRCKTGGSGTERRREPMTSESVGLPCKGTESLPSGLSWIRI